MTRVRPDTWVGFWLYSRARVRALIRYSRGPSGVELSWLLVPSLLTFACAGEGHYGLELDGGDESEVDSGGGPVSPADAEACSAQRDASEAGGCSEIVVEGAFNQCAQVGSYLLSPLSTLVGAEVDLTAVADDKENDPVVYEWTAAKGTFSRPDWPETKYRCDEAGEQLLKLTVSDSPECVSSVEIPVVCLAAP